MWSAPLLVRLKFTSEVPRGERSAIVLGFDRSFVPEGYEPVETGNVRRGDLRAWEFILGKRVVWVSTITEEVGQPVSRFLAIIRPTGR